MRLKILFLLLLFTQKNFLSANPVTGFNAFYKNGQVFCTWTNSSSSGIEYHLYRSPLPILHGSYLTSCQYLGAVRDSSSYNKHLSEIESQPYYLKIDSQSSPLDNTTGLFVATSQQNGNFYYALTTVNNGTEDTAIILGENSLSFPVIETIDRPKLVHQASINVNNHLVDVYVLFTSLTATTLFPQMINVGSYPFNVALYKTGTVPPHPLTIRLSGGGSNFLSGIATGTAPNEYRLGLDDWLPNDESSTWFGYNEQYDFFSHVNSPPVSGVNRDYALQRLEYAIDWAIRNLPVDSNSIYFSGVSGGASGAFFSSLTNPSRIAAASLKVPKFDLSFLHDPDTTNLYNEGMPGRLRVDTLLGTVSTNLPTNSGVFTYDLLNGGWLAHQHANDNVPLLFAVNGRRDTTVGWAEKIPYYDSVNANRLGGFYYWDNRKHSGLGQQWVFAPNLFRYHRNVSFPAFSNCSFNNNPGDGHTNNGDTLGTINGFLDWNDLITDDTDHYRIAVFMHDLQTYFTTVVSPDSCITDVTLRRLQNFAVPIGAWIFWKDEHHEQLVHQDSFLYTGGLITLHGVKIFRDTSVITVTFGIPSGLHSPGNSLPLISIYPNPATQYITLDGYLQNSSHVSILITDVLGKEWFHYNYTESSNHFTSMIDVRTFPPGVYFVKVNGGVKTFVRQ
jgi:hypothetical protein